MTAADIDVVLFDLGGVLIDVRGVGTMRALAAMDDDDELWRRWLTCPWVRRFESGGCSAEEFAAGIIDEWKLAIEPTGFLESFATWPEAAYPGAEELVRAVRATARVGCLSNTNVLHWQRQFSVSPVVRALDHVFLSFELGMVKPDVETFEHVAGCLGVAPARVLFLDDNVLNVDAATAAGFVAAHVRGVEGARRALAHAGVLG